MGIDSNPTQAGEPRVGRPNDVATEAAGGSPECEPSQERRAAQEHLSRVLDSLPPIVPVAPDEVVATNPQYASQYGTAHATAIASGECPFCKPEWQLEALCTLGEWMVRRNPFPGKDRLGLTVKHHFLFARRSHTGPDYRLAPEDMAVIAELKNWCMRRFEIKALGIAVREGDPTEAGRTIVHAHVHGVATNWVTTEDGRRIVVPFDFPFG